MASDRPGPAGDRSEGAVPDRTGSWIALAIALAPIPIALAISIALRSPPWKPRAPEPPPRPGGAATAPAHPRH